MKVFTDFVQYSTQWWEIRRGHPTASEFSRIFTPGGKVSKSADDYICSLIADTVNPNSIQPQGFVSPAMNNGSLLEPEARNFYCMERNCDVTEVGFCLDDQGRYGCSPDALTSDDGGFECKCPLLKTQASYLLAGCLPDEHKLQVHGCLIVTGLKYWDYLSYSPPLPALLVRVYPDKFTELLRSALDDFWKNYQSALAKVRSIGSALEVKQEPAKEVDSLAGTPLEETKAANRKTAKRNNTFAQDTIDAHAALLPDYLKDKK